MEFDDLRNRERQRRQVVGDDPLLRDAGLESAKKALVAHQEVLLEEGRRVPLALEVLLQSLIGRSRRKQCEADSLERQVPRAEVRPGVSSIDAANERGHLQAACTPQGVVQLDGRRLRREPEQAEEEVKVRRCRGVVSELRSVSEALAMCAHESAGSQSPHHAVSLTRPPSTAPSHRLRVS